jgi:hypothetical protein
MTRFEHVRVICARWRRRYKKMRKQRRAVSGETSRPLAGRASERR